MNARQRRVMVRWWRRCLDAPELTTEEAQECETGDWEMWRHIRRELNNAARARRARHGVRKL